MLSVVGISAQYGRARVLHDVSFDVAEGEIVSVVGANGAGKTTLVKVISGMVRPTAGQHPVRRRGHHGVAGARDRAARHRPRSRRTASVRRHDGARESDARLDASGCTAHTGRKAWNASTSCFRPYASGPHQLAGTLSGGEQQMVAIARGLMARPRLLMLDEPSLGLAPRIVTEIFDVIAKLNEGGLTVLLIEQNVKHSLTIADHGIVLENGRIVLADTGDALLQNDHTRRAYLGL